MVQESTGEWDAQAAQVLQEVSRTAAAREGARPDLLQNQLLQELCVAARTVRARAVLRRRAAEGPVVLVAGLELYIALGCGAAAGLQGPTHARPELFLFSTASQARRGADFTFRVSLC